MDNFEIMCFASIEQIPTPRAQAHKAKSTRMVAASTT